MQSDEWKKLILDWSKIIDAQNLAESPGNKRIFDRVHGFGAIGASEETIKATEARLGIALPESYREFLKASNGLKQPFNQMPTTGGDFWTVEEIDWFRVRNSDWVSIWVEDDFDVPDAEYFVYGSQQDSCKIRPKYLKTALEISHDGDSGIYLLIPDQRNEEGEWEAWHFANWMPGAARYRSFEEMMKTHYENLKNNRDIDRYFGF